MKKIIPILCSLLLMSCQKTEVKEMEKTFRKVEIQSISGNKPLLILNEEKISFFQMLQLSKQDHLTIKTDIRGAIYLDDLDSTISYPYVHYRVLLDDSLVSDVDGNEPEQVLEF